MGDHGAPLGSPSRLLGYVQLRVGARVYALPVQAVRMDRDGAGDRGSGKRRAGGEPGGFYTDGAELGILVDSEASEREMQAQIERASADAARYISSKYLN